MLPRCLSIEIAVTEINRFSMQYYIKARPQWAFWQRAQQHKGLVDVSVLQQGSRQRNTSKRFQFEWLSNSLHSWGLIVQFLLKFAQWYKVYTTRYSTWGVIGVVKTVCCRETLHCVTGRIESEPNVLILVQPWKALCNFVLKSALWINVLLSI